MTAPPPVEPTFYKGHRKAFWTKLFRKRTRSRQTPAATQPACCPIIFEATTSSIVEDDSIHKDDYLELLVEPLDSTPRKSDKASRKTVRFDETANVTIAGTDDSDTTELWYTDQEIHIFHVQFYDLIQTLQMEHKHYVLTKSLSSSCNWMSHLRRVYQSFCARRIRERAQLPHPDGIVVGAERYAVPGLLSDVARRRQSLYHVAMQRQFCNPQAMARTCRSVSLPSRLYARYLADQVAASTWAHHWRGEETTS